MSTFDPDTSREQLAQAHARADEARLVIAINLMSLRLTATSVDNPDTAAKLTADIDDLVEAFSDLMAAINDGNKVNVEATERLVATVRELAARAGVR